LFCDADISPLLAKSDDPKMVDDPAVLDVVKQLDKACTEAGFFYVVIIPSLILREFDYGNFSENIVNLP
jgi:isopenicillin N synthase-like dioxygenase